MPAARCNANSPATCAADALSANPAEIPISDGSAFVDPMTSITMRRRVVETRASPGHWEGDLIIGANGKSAIATLVERSSRYVMLAHLGDDRTAESVWDSLITTMSPLPTALRGTLTWDQGAEMAEHRAFASATNIEGYFCDPVSPWQRGSNENTNGLLRQHFPRSSDLLASVT